MHLHDNHCRRFLLGQPQYPAEMGNNGYAKILRVNKVHCGLCENIEWTGELACSIFFFQFSSERSDPEHGDRMPEHAYHSEIMSKILYRKEVFLSRNFSHRRLR